MTHLSVHRVSLSSIHSGTLVFSIKQFVPGFVSVLYEIASFSESENCNIIARLNGFLPFLCCNRFCYQPKREQQGRKIERVRTRNASRLSLEYRNTIDANWAKDEDSAFTNLYLDLQLIPTRRFRLAQPKDPKGV